MTPTSLFRRRALRTCTALSLAWSVHALADASGAWPTRPITLVVPYAAGGNVDTIARWIAPELSNRLGQSVVISNLSGAGGVIGTERVVRAKPDGYTLLFSVESTIVIARMVTPATVKYNGLTDLQPVTLLSAEPLTLVGKPEFAARNAAELFDLIQQNPGRYNYASSGVGTSLHLGGELLNQLADVSMTHVPYRVGPQIVTELLGNQIDLAVLPLSMVKQQTQDSPMRIYGVMSPNPSPALPGVPPLGEQVPAWKDAHVTVWQGIFAPVGTPAPIVARLNHELGEILRMPDLQKKFEDAGLTRMGMGPVEFAAFLRAEEAKFAQVVEQGRIQIE